MSQTEYTENDDELSRQIAILLAKEDRVLRLVPSLLGTGYINVGMYALSFVNAIRVGHHLRQIIQNNGGHKQDDIATG